MAIAGTVGFIAGIALAGVSLICWLGWRGDTSFAVTRSEAKDRRMGMRWIWPQLPGIPKA